MIAGSREIRVSERNPPVRLIAQHIPRRRLAVQAEEKPRLRIHIRVAPAIENDPGDVPPRIESAAEVATRIAPYRELLMARDVMVGPQCGLELIPRDAAFDKLLQSRYLRETLQKEWRWRS